MRWIICLWLVAGVTQCRHLSGSTTSSHHHRRSLAKVCPSTVFECGKVFFFGWTQTLLIINHVLMVRRSSLECQRNKKKKRSAAHEPPRLPISFDLFSWHPSQREIEKKKKKKKKLAGTEREMMLETRMKRMFLLLGGPSSSSSEGLPVYERPSQRRVMKTVTLACHNKVPRWTEPPLSRKKKKVGPGGWPFSIIHQGRASRRTCDISQLHRLQCPGHLLSGSIADERKMLSVHFFFPLRSSRTRRGAVKRGVPLRLHSLLIGGRREAGH